MAGSRFSLRSCLGFLFKTLLFLILLALVLGAVGKRAARKAAEELNLSSDNFPDDSIELNGAASLVVLLGEERHQQFLQTLTKQKPAEDNQK